MTSNTFIVLKIPFSIFALFRSGFKVSRRSRVKTEPEGGISDFGPAANPQTGFVTTFQKGKASAASG